MLTTNHKIKYDFTMKDPVMVNEFKYKSGEVDIDGIDVEALNVTMPPGTGVMANWVFEGPNEYLFVPVIGEVIDEHNLRIWPPQKVLKEGAVAFEIVLTDGNGWLMKGPTATIRVTKSLIVDTAIEQELEAIMQLLGEAQSLKNAVITLNERMTEAETLRESRVDDSIADMEELSSSVSAVRDEAVAAVNDANTVISQMQDMVTAGTVDFETMQARTDCHGTLHESLKKRLDSDYTEIKDYFPAPEFYGVEFIGSNPVGRRLGLAAGLTANVAVGSEIVVNDFDNHFPWCDIVTVNLADDGTINAYEGDPNFTRDGSNGNVMVRIPKFYQKRVSPNKDYKAYFISRRRLDGYYLNPIFVDSETGQELDFAYIGAYEASQGEDRLFSIFGTIPVKSIRLASARALAGNIGPGWQLQDFMIRDVLKSLLYIELGTLDLQDKMYGCAAKFYAKTTTASTNSTYLVTSNTSASTFFVNQVIKVLGEYRVLLSKDEHDDLNTRLNISGLPIAIPLGTSFETFGWASGACDSIASSIGSMPAEKNKSPFIYRGIENLWGNMSEFVDGVLVREGRALIQTNPKLFTNSTAEASFVLPQGFGYVEKVFATEQHPYFSMPEIARGTSSTHYCDRVITASSSERFVSTGGSFVTGSGPESGPSGWNWDSLLTSSSLSTGARLQYKPSGGSN